MSFGAFDSDWFGIGSIIQKLKVGNNERRQLPMWKANEREGNLLYYYANE